MRAMEQVLDSINAQSLGIATALFGGFVAYLLVATRLVPGPTRLGARLPDGTQLTYPMNGFRIFLLTAALLGLGTGLGVVNLAILHEHFWSLFVVANLFSIAHSVLGYLTGSERRERGLLAGLWYGTELNPSWLGVDLKVFAYRPSLVGLAILNASFAAMQYQLYGTISTAMCLYQGFTFFYLASSFQYEHGLLSMWDVIEERFGFMLIWGDYVVVPFFYCIPGWYLIHDTTPMPLWAAGGLVCMFVFGFWMFRGANEQKNQFKRDPSALIWGKTPETVGGRLLVSGFWGIGRKLNYSGEILVYLSFTLTTGFGSWVPYVLNAWLISLLTHRAHRDDKRCRTKYGEVWEAYCRRARFKMVPFIY